MKPTEDHYKLAYEESYRLGSQWRERAELLELRMERVKTMLRTMRRVPAPNKGLGAVQRAMDLEVNAVIDLILAAWPATTHEVPECLRADTGRRMDGETF